MARTKSTNSTLSSSSTSSLKTISGSGSYSTTDHGERAMFCWAPHIGVLYFLLAMFLAALISGLYAVSRSSSGSSVTLKSQENDYISVSIFIENNPVNQTKQFTNNNLNYFNFYTDPGFTTTYFSNVLTPSPGKFEYLVTTPGELNSCTIKYTPNFSEAKNGIVRITGALSLTGQYSTNTLLNQVEFQLVGSVDPPTSFTSASVLGKNVYLIPDNLEYIYSFTIPFSYQLTLAQVPGGVFYIFPLISTNSSPANSAFVSLITFNLNIHEVPSPTSHN